MVGWLLLVVVRFVLMVSWLVLVMSRLGVGIGHGSGGQSEEFHDDELVHDDAGGWLVDAHSGLRREMITGRIH